MHKFSLLFLLCLLCFQALCQYQMPVSNVTSYRPAQGDTESSNMIDGNIETIYHSDWNINAIPDTLTFYFNQLIPEINNIKYVPRQTQYNGVWTKVNVLASEKSNPEKYILLNTKPLDWAIDNNAKTWDFPSSIKEPYAIKIVVLAAVGNFSSCAEMEFYGSLPVRPDGSTDCVISLSNLKIIKDNKLTISKEGSYASSYQPGENIEKSFDGNLSTLYHSNWNQAYTALPIELVYRFSKVEDIDYLIYYPRKEGYNGFFGETSIYYLNENSLDYDPLIDYDFAFNGLDTRVNFPSRIQTREIKIVVKSGEGGFVSCAEMEFYKKNENSGQEPFPYSDIFSSVQYDGLQSHISTIDIAKMESGFYQSLASCLLSDNYNKKLRSRTYRAYESLSQLSRKLKTSRYDAYENPTGLLFAKGDTIVAFASGISADPAYLRVKDFANEDNPDDYTYQLSNGANVIIMRGNGLGYISYYTDNPEKAPAITVNIVNGKVNGYYDIDIHTAEDWKSIMSKTIYKKVDLIGKYVHLNYDRIPLRINNPVDIKPLIQLYDSIVQWQRIQMGLYKYNHNITNHMFGESGTGGGYYASGQGIHLDLTWGPTAIAKVSELDMWGIPHEFGHVNQIRPGLRWIGTTEVTNNIYAVWANYLLNRNKVPYTRLEAETFQTEGSPNRVMNRYNSIINELHHQQTHIQETKQDYPFRVLVPFWQLQLYYQVAGACRDGLPLTYDQNPVTDPIDYAHWYGYIAEKVRNTDESGLDDGTLLLNFYKNTCDAVQEDLTDFFIRMGLLRVVDTEIDDYGTGRLKISQAQLNEAIKSVQTKYTLQPVSPVIHYISALTVDTYRKKTPLSGKNGEGYSEQFSGNNPYLEVNHTVWKNSVAYETYDSNGNLLQSTLTGTGDLNNKKTLVPFLDGTKEVYAVGFDGNKILVWPKVVKTSDIQHHNNFIITPNLISNNESIQLKSETITTLCYLSIFSASGQLFYHDSGYLENLNNKLQKVNFDNPGIYYIQLKTNNHTLQNHFIKIN